ncbi:hypothetical protein MUP77_18690 [Candidatus Bathyarchaeota archaeon]|jgi:hypothetical protein|nr:hypothetical protein [Candidatus Bathyarchaeota archaeon]
MVYDLKRLVPAAIILLGILALVSAFMAILTTFMFLYIPGGAAPYVHFTQTEIIIRYLTMAYAFIAAGVDLFIAIGFFRLYEPARKTAFILAPMPFIGTVLQLLGIASTLNGTNYLLEILGISFPILAPFTLPFINGIFQNISLYNLTGWHAIVTTVFFIFGILNLGLFFFLSLKEVKELFKTRA